MTPLTPAQRAWSQALKQALAASSGGRWIEAETAGRKAVELARALPLPEGADDLAASLNLLGTILQGLGKSEEAKACYAEALERASEPRARVVALANLGAAERESGAYVEAEQHLAEALGAAREGVSEELDGLLDKWARLLQQTDREEAALEVFRERVRLTEPVAAAPDSEATAAESKPSDAHLDALFHLASAELEHGAAEMAGGHFKELSEKMVLRGGARSLGRAQALTGLARARQQAGQHVEAVAAAREALDVREAMLGKDHPELLTARHNLAHVLLAAGKAREAEPLARAVVESVAHMPADDARRVAAVGVLIGVLEKTGRLREAGTLKKQLSKS
ncbi:MAG: tetratricopeptide repeat protein [Candidatus Sericytochromatia bacterium]|nr:tetratricopeptide repeat protein [Candidatus Sericytochromatia bacterium]